MEAAKRITETVNEQKRLEENRELKKDLAERITDLKVRVDCFVVVFDSLILTTFY